MSKKHSDKKRFVGLDPAVTAVMANGAVPNRAAMSAKQRKDRKRKRVMYDIDPAIKVAVQKIAKQEDTSASQLVEMLVVFGLRAYQRGDAELRAAMELSSRERSRTPRFYWNLVIPDEWMNNIETRFSQAQKAQKRGV